MTDVIMSQDPILRARAFLKGYFPRVEIRVPRGWDWTDTLIVIRDGGGRGEYSLVLSDSRITVEVSGPSVATASLTARKVLALLRSWQDLEPGVYWRSEVGRPAYFPDDDTGTPLYVFTVALAFLAESATVEPL